MPLHGEQFSILFLSRLTYMKTKDMYPVENETQRLFAFLGVACLKLSNWAVVWDLFGIVRQG